MLRKYPKLYRLQDSMNEASTNVLNIIRLKRRPRPQTDKRLDGKTIIVTGCNRGIGKFIAADLAWRGARVIMAVRDVEGGEKAKEEMMKAIPGGKADITVMKLDMGSIHSIQDFVNKIIESEVRLDYIVNNAAILSSSRSKSDQGFESMMSVNYYGVVYLTIKLMDKMLATSSDARIFLMSSLAHHETSTVGWQDMHWPHDLNYFQQYGRTKLALMLFGRELIRRTYSRGMRVYIVDPGVSKTDLGRDMTPFHQMLFHGSITRPFMRSPQEGANSMILSLLSDQEKYDPKYYYFTDGKVKLPSVGSTNDYDARDLWVATSRLLSLNQMENL